MDSRAGAKRRGVPHESALKLPHFGEGQQVRQDGIAAPVFVRAIRMQPVATAAVSKSTSGDHRSFSPRNQRKAPPHACHRHLHPRATRTGRRKSSPSLDRLLVEGGGQLPEVAEARSRPAGTARTRRLQRRASAAISGRRRHRRTLRGRPVAIKPAADARCRRRARPRTTPSRAFRPREEGHQRSAGEWRIAHPPESSVGNGAIIVEPEEGEDPGSGRAKSLHHGQRLGEQGGRPAAPRPARIAARAHQAPTRCAHGYPRTLAPRASADRSP